MQELSMPSFPRKREALLNGKCRSSILLCLKVNVDSRFRGNDGEEE
jgi:hypothetical protein